LAPIFRHEGLRQEEPLSPKLLNLVVDALAIILERRKKRGGLIKGLMLDMIADGLVI
jgi:hypothetical protein